MRPVLCTAIVVLSLALAPLAQADGRERAAVSASVTYRDGETQVRAERTAPGRVRLSFPDGRSASAGITRDAIVQLTAGRNVLSTLAARGLRLVRPLLPSAGLYLVRSERAAEDGLDVAVRLDGQLQAVPDFAFARRRAQISVPPDDPRLAGQWYLDKIEIEKVWPRASGDAKTVVVVVDDGCDLKHPDLQAHMEPGVDLVDGDDDPSFAPGQEGNGHGTACAGIVAAVGDNGQGIAGVCPECHLRCVRLLPGNNMEVTISADVEAFEHALKWKAAVVSNSWGFVDSLPAPAPLAAAMREVLEHGRGGRGALIVFAAGNDAREIRDDEIYGIPGVITVGATNAFDEAAPFSNFGAPLDLVAPAGTLTTDPRGAEGLDPGDYTGLFGGTSAAAPVVAGVAALLVSAAPEASGTAIAEALLESARPAPFASEEGLDPLYGRGIVDPAAALDALLGHADAGVGSMSMNAGQSCGCRVIAPHPPALSALLLACAAMLLAMRRQR